MYYIYIYICVCVCVCIYIYIYIYICIRTTKVRAHDDSAQALSQGIPNFSAEETSAQETRALHA